MLLRHVALSGGIVGITEWVFYYNDESAPDYFKIKFKNSRISIIIHHNNQSLSNMVSFIFCLSKLSSGEIALFNN